MPPASVLLPPFHRAPKPKRCGPRFADVCAIRDPVQQRLTKPGFGNTVVHSEDGKFVVTMSAAFTSIRDQMKLKFRSDVRQRHVADFIQWDQSRTSSIASSPAA